MSTKYYTNDKSIVISMLAYGMV